MGNANRAIMGQARGANKGGLIRLPDHELFPCLIVTLCKNIVVFTAFAYTVLMSSSCAQQRFFPRVGLAITSHVSVKSILYDYAAFMVYCFIHGRSHRGGAGAAAPVPIGHNTFSLTFLRMFVI